MGATTEAGACPSAEVKLKCALSPSNPVLGAERTRR